MSICPSRSSSHFVCNYFIWFSTTFAAYDAVSTIFWLALARGTCCIMRQSMSLKVIFDDFHQYCPRWLFATSCQFGCEGGQDTHVCTYPASELLQGERARVHDLHILARVSCGCIRATLSLKALCQASPRDIHAFTLSLLRNFLRRPIISYGAYSPCSLPPSHYPKGRMPYMRFVVSLIVVKKGAHCASQHLVFSVQSCITRT